MNVGHMFGLRILLLGTLVLGIPASVSFLSAQESVSAQRQEEALDYYQKWLRQDVLYIITPEELSVFSKLQTEAERENFIEQFWRRRDTDPTTALNEYKEEHYRRIAYANEHFQSGIPGWKTDRGLIYIKFGPPDYSYASRTGGHYERPSWEGGGNTSTYPYEQWEYRYIDGVGQDIEIEFVDPTLTGEYKLTTNAQEKDALLQVGNMGLTLAEAWGLVDQKIDRIVQKTSPSPTNNALITGGVGRLKDQPFEKLQTITNLSKAPLIKFSDLETEIQSQVFFNSVPFQVRSDVFRGTSSEGRAIITLYIRNQDLTFIQKGNFYNAKVEVYGVIKDVAGRIIKEIGAPLFVDIPAASFEAEKEETIAYQSDLWLAPGRYKLQFYVKDTQGERLGTSQTLLLVPAPQQDDLEISSVMLARRFESAPVEGDYRKRFKLWPIATKQVDVGLGRIAFYYEVYNYAIDQSSGKPDFSLSYLLLDNEETVLDAVFELHSVDFVDDRAQIFAVLRNEDLQPGQHALKILVHDRITQKHLEKPVPFRLQ